MMKLRMIKALLTLILFSNVHGGLYTQDAWVTDTFDNYGGFTSATYESEDFTWIAPMFDEEESDYTFIISNNGTKGYQDDDYLVGIVSSDTIAIYYDYDD